MTNLKKTLIVLCPLMLTACFGQKAKLNEVEHGLAQVTEKVDSLLTYTNTTQDRLTDMDIRMETLEQDARKRGVYTRVKGSDVQAQQTRPRATTPSYSKKDTPAQPWLANPEVAPTMANTPLTTHDMSASKDNGKKNGDDKKNATENTLDFPRDTQTSPVASQNSQVGAITGQNLSQGANAPSPAVSPSPAPSMQAGLTPATPAVSMHTPSPASYDQALALYQQRRYQEAEQAFDSFLQANPQGVLAPNALYWKGETYYARGDYANAIFAFKEVQTRYPKHPKTADSLLKTGMSYTNLGDSNNAELHYAVLREDFPGSSAASRIPQ